MPELKRIGRMARAIWRACDTEPIPDGEGVIEREYWRDFIPEARAADSASEADKLAEEMRHAISHLREQLADPRWKDMHPIGRCPVLEACERALAEWEEQE